MAMTISIMTLDGYVSRGKSPPSSVPRDHAMLQDFAAYLELRLMCVNMSMLRRIFADFLNDHENTLVPMMQLGSTIITLYPILRTSAKRRHQAKCLLKKRKYNLDTRGCVFLYLQCRTATRNMALFKQIFLEFVNHQEDALLAFVERGNQVISVIPFELPQRITPECKPLLLEKSNNSSLSIENATTEKKNVAEEIRENHVTKRKRDISKTQETSSCLTNQIITREESATNSDERRLLNKRKRDVERDDVMKSHLQELQKKSMSVKGVKSPQTDASVLQRENIMATALLVSNSPLTSSRDLNASRELLHVFPMEAIEPLETESIAEEQETEPLSTTVPIRDTPSFMTNDVEDEQGASTLILNHINKVTAECVALQEDATLTTPTDVLQETSHVVTAVLQKDSIDSPDLVQNKARTARQEEKTIVSDLLPQDPIETINSDDEVEIEATDFTRSSNKSIRSLTHNAVITSQLASSAVLNNLSTRGTSNVANSTSHTFLQQVDSSEALASTASISTLSTHSIIGFTDTVQDVVSAATMTVIEAVLSEVVSRIIRESLEFKRGQKHKSHVFTLNRQVASQHLAHKPSKHEIAYKLETEGKSHKRGKPVMSEEMCQSQMVLARKITEFELQTPWEMVFANLSTPFHEKDHPVLAQKLHTFWSRHARAVWERNFWAPVSRKLNLIEFNKRNNRQLAAKNAFESLIVSAYKELGAVFFFMLDSQEPRHPGWWYRGPVVALFAFQMNMGEDAMWKYVKNEAFKRFPDCKQPLPLTASNSGAMRIRHERQSASMWMNNHHQTAAFLQAIAAHEAKNDARTELMEPPDCELETLVIN
ncbi:hypothetical protein CCR75_001901 [Bremia lactucae]|uniref:Uncharacterized protein n=1 Tax=Bremia lactucae TaxID=4779 RepID=A0A976FI04_BRELC|nr:hypothetical protein CCR75_001901 [Bremia lactucae]